MLKVFLNDNMVDAELATVSVADGGWLYGAGLFETLLCRQGVVFCLEDHLDRLLASAAKLSMELPLDKAFLAKAVGQVLRANDLSDARLRITVTTGPVSVPEDSKRPTVLVSASPFEPYPEAYYKKGVLVVLSEFRQNPSDPLAGHKTTSYFSRMMALRQAHRNRAAEALWFTTDGNLAEGCISNVFLVKDGRVLTPPLDTPVLPGIARKTVIRLAGEESIELIQKELTIDDLLGADEVFLTNVIMMVLPVAGIEKHAMALGPVAQRLKAAFEKEVLTRCNRGS